MGAESFDRRAAAVHALSGHPTVIDVVRIATSLTVSPAEVVVFEQGRAMVVGSLENGLLQPRPLTPTEDQLLADGGRLARGANVTSAAIFGGDREPIGALTVDHGAGLPDADVLLGLCRIVSSLLEERSGSHGWHETLLENLRDAVVVLDDSMVITYANRAVGIQIGRSPAEIVGTHVVDLLHPDDIDAAFDSLLRLGSGAEVYRLAVRVRHGLGDFIRLEATGRDLTADPTVGGIVLSLRNGDHDLELETTLDRTRQLTDAVVEQLHDGIIATDAVGSVLVVNEVARRLLDLPAGTFLAELAIDGLGFLDVDALPVAPDRHPIRRVLGGEHMIREPMSVVSEGEVRHLVVSGRPVSSSDGSLVGAAIGFHDVTDSRRYQRELQRSALHDHLTGLANRRQLKAKVSELPLSAVAGDHRPVSETLIDLDNFKVINDTHGHRIGDHVIQITAGRLAEACGPDDLLVRLGGDEFVVLSRGRTPGDAVAAADAMRRRLAEPFEIDGHAFSLTCSIGVAHLEVDGLHEDSLLRYADLALYEAKARGRNRVALFDSQLAEATRIAARQREFLRQVLDEDGLVMNFQPFVDAASGRIVGFESLARCRIRSGALVGPADFLEAASGSGLIWELDRRAFELTCSAAAMLADRVAGLTIACNFSPLSIVQPDFVDHVERTMRHRGLEPSMIAIEVTESAAFEGGGVALDALHAVHRLGVRLVLDDFGTGYSSLSHLRDLALAQVKVDRSFVAAALESTSERAIAEAVVELAHGLGVAVVAEGVETEEQLAWARSAGFDIIQGWYYSPARGLEEILDALTADTDDTDGPMVPAHWGNRYDHGVTAAARS